MENTYKILILVAITLGAIIGVYSLDKWASDKKSNNDLGSRFDSVRSPAGNCTSTVFVVGATSTVVSNSFSRNYSTFINSTSNTIFVKQGLLAASGSGIALYPGDPSIRSTSSANDRLKIYGEEWNSTVTAYALVTNSALSVIDCR